MRRFLRHPTDIPIEVQKGDGGALRQPLRDVSHGGLCFRHTEPVDTGTIVSLRIAFARPVFETQARVIWCLPEGQSWQVGVEFLDPDARFRARMVEQVCHIEQYRRDELRRHGRTLSSHEAALEWIEKFARVFPPTGEL